MKRTTLVSILSLSILAGCGGGSAIGGGTSGGGGGGGNPYDGSWGGSWSSPSSGRTGRVSITISNGSISGTSVIDVTGEKGPFKGTISKTGDVTATVEYPKWPVIQITGNVPIGSNGRMTGDLTQAVNGSSSTFKIDLGRK